MNEFIYRLLVLVFAGLSFYLANTGNAAGLAGFIVAGALSLIFLKLDAFKEFSGGGMSAKLHDRLDKVEQKLEPIEAHATEPDANNGKGEERSDPSWRVLHALTNGEYTWRTFDGLRKETNLSDSELRETLIKLAADGVVGNKPFSSRELWSATQAGYGLARVYKQHIDK